MTLTINQGQNHPLPSIKQLRQAIPAHCFERPFLKSFSYILRDAFFGLIIGYAALKFIPFQITPLSILLWTIYAIVQGTVLMGLWVIGHECGHGAFSSSKLVNDIFGYILHSALLVPYFSWQRTHHVHHSKCQHMVDGESHVPNLKEQTQQINEFTYKFFGEDGFIIVQIFNHLVLGWPLYLLIHATGSRRSPVTKKPYTSTPNHFSPFASNELFPKELRFKIFLSTVGVVGMLAFLTYLGFLFGLKTIILMYAGPYFVINAWLVTITWLQHTDPHVPQLGEDEWEWLYGATMTIDRNYPQLIDILHHRIGTTHVLHHIFPEIAFYHAQEASEVVKKLLGPHYRYDPSTIGQAIWRSASECHYVESLSGVQYFKSFLKEKRGAKSA